MATVTMNMDEVAAIASSFKPWDGAWSEWWAIYTEMEKQQTEWEEIQEDRPVLAIVITERKVGGE